jgi:UDP-N-acetyl-D-glucosamine dehydrogenase
MTSDKKTLAVVGLGYVGLPMALLAEKKGYQVVGIDIDEEKVKKINEREAPFSDDKIGKDLKNSKLAATTDFGKIKTADIVAICVPTPIDENHLPDLSPVESASRSIAAQLKPGQLVILESTVNPGVTENVFIPMLEKGSGLKAGKDFYVAHCPERINPGDGKWTVENIPRVVGSLEKKGLIRAIEFYSNIIEAAIKPLKNLKEAEAVKIVENSFRDINIAFVNELAMSFSKLGIDLTSVIEGAATKPFAFMPHFPGCGVGGHCIPVDPYYLIESAKKEGFHHDFLSLARRINSGMPKFTVELLQAALNEKKIPIKDARVVLLGLAYKPEVDDLRESPSFKIAKYLEAAGAQVIKYDPFVPDQSEVSSLDEALSGAQAAIVATAHYEFINLSPEDLKKHNIEVIIDGRNCLDKAAFLEAGIIYKGIGR